MGGRKDIFKMLVPYLKVLKTKKKPFHERELIYTVSEIARTLGVSETHLQWIPKAKLLIAVGGRLDYSQDLVPLYLVSDHTRLPALPQNMPSSSIGRGT